MVSIGIFCLAAFVALCMGYFVGVWSSAQIKGGEVGQKIWVALRGVEDPEDDEGVIVELISAHATRRKALYDMARADSESTVWTDTIELDLED